ncbi:MAG: hypothetical protein ACPG9N_07465 [Miltoncostaeaceae bacterium]
MSDFLPWLFIIVAAVSVVGGLACLWLSLSLALSDESSGGARAQIITDARRAMEPGYTTADEAVRAVVRGAGSGLALAAGLVAAEGGLLEVEDNLGGGTVVTITVDAAPAPDDPSTGPSDAQRRLLALLLEMSPAHPETMARELDLPLGVVGRELVLMEHRGLVARFADGGRVLTERGAAIVATLF